MRNFTFYNPTAIFFGKGVINQLEEQIPKDVNNILVVYGGGSIKKIGLYDQLIRKLYKKHIYELEGVMPNPRLEKVYEGIKICKQKKIEFIIAAGGGSVIDCAKAIAVGAKTNKDVWNCFYENKEDCEEALPIGVILTLSATGSEMNNDSVITNWSTHQKLNYTSNKTYPKFAILDPEYTYSLSKEQTIYGAIDILAHVFEQYFSIPDDLNLSDELSEGIIKNVIRNINIVQQDLRNYDGRACLMWASTMALNGIIGLGKEQDWSSHNIGHALSAIYDIPHGATLSIIFPSWMNFVYKKALSKFKRFAIEIWNVDSKGKTDDEIAKEGIIKTKEYFSKLGAPVSLREVNIYEKDINEIIKHIDIDNAGSYIKISQDDIKEILLGCL